MKQLVVSSPRAVTAGGRCLYMRICIPVVHRTTGPYVYLLRHGCLLLHVIASGDAKPRHLVSYAWPHGFPCVHVAAGSARADVDVEPDRSAASRAWGSNSATIRVVLMPAEARAAWTRCARLDTGDTRDGVVPR